MSYLPQLIEDEINYICSIIPYQDKIRYFNKNAKEFNKIRPGFRAKSISEAEATRLLISNISKHFISDFIEKKIDIWLTQIKDHYNERMHDGESHIIALLHTLPYSVFDDNIKLYFKLVGEELLAEHVEILGEAVWSIKEADGEQAKLHEEIKVKDSTIVKLQSELNAQKYALNKSMDKLKNNAWDIDALKRKVAELEKIQIAAQIDKQKIESLVIEIQAYEEKTKRLRKELSETKNNSRKLEKQIRAELEKQQAIKVTVEQSGKNAKCPNDMDEFKDYLGYNFENIGMSTGAEYYHLLTTHLGKILFQGIPIIVNRETGLNIMKCVANTIIGQSNVNTFVFNNSVSTHEVERFLSSSGRIICLDNFIGNFNETELLPSLEKHRDKIIFITVAYDRTIHYISQEFLRYCHYLNVNRIKALSINATLTEDPSKIAEIDYEPRWNKVENRYSTILREILQELGFPQSLIELKCVAIFDEQDLIQMLAFDILPYCTDVLQINPYNTSERLIKYAGNAGRCLYKKLFVGWFAL
ncbi:hypothetical protein ACPUYX_09830 [Desulfosporosinus sp. SYSU MS00001]|uniref:hypothetical protein n=1 Tax=Desulfosporosinus sp. SYSU MS00001 TaxID=3416284 RepID=UPI003CF28CA9